MKQVLQLAAGLFIAIGLAGCTANEIFDEEIQADGGAVQRSGERVGEIPAGCTRWFDGCNSCSVTEDGEKGACTKKACKGSMETPSCKAFAEGFSAPETPEATTAADEEAAPDTMPEVARDAVDVTEGCKIWFDGCNQCVVMGGRLRGCTSKVCTTMSEPSCIK